VAVQSMAWGTAPTQPRPWATLLMASIPTGTLRARRPACSTKPSQLLNCDTEQPLTWAPATQPTGCFGAGRVSLSCNECGTPRQYVLCLLPPGSGEFGARFTTTSGLSGMISLQLTGMAGS
jgi:hypothetical protein